MKEIKAEELEIGDVFIDGDAISEVVSLSSGYIAYIKVKLIVGPSYRGHIGSDREYYLHIDNTVLLCEVGLE